MTTDIPPLDFTPVTDDELHALIDDQLPASEREALQARVAQQPLATARLGNWQEQRALLGALHAGVLVEPVPQAMQDALRRSAPRRQQVLAWWRWGGMAASLVLAFGVGWMSQIQWSGRAERGANLMVQSELPTFVRDAGLAYAVYAPEKRHPVEVAATEQAHLLQWLSRRTGRALQVPDLSAQGYRLMGGRLLPGKAGDRAQFMFENADGQRITLYLGALTQVSSPASNANETAFRFSGDSPVPSFYWVDQGFGYALSGSLPRESLTALAESIYHQLQDR